MPHSPSHPSRLADTQVTPKGLLGSLLMAMGMIEWGSAWFFPVDGRNYFTITRPFGSEYRVMLWGVVVVSALAMLAGGRLIASIKGFAPYAAFLAIALAASILGDQTSNSAWYVAQWLVMVIAGLAAGALTPPALLRRTGLFVFAAVLAGSLLLYLAVPSIGSMQSGGRGGLLRGLFPGKQFAGWFAALACVWCVSLRVSRLDPLRLGLLALALVVLVRAQSAGAVVVLAGGLGYYCLLRVLQRLPILVWARVAISAAALASVALATQVGLPALLAVLGRDPTLTGRTELWAIYWKFMQNSQLIGRGPGAFAAGSTLNFSIAPHLDKDYVVSVHNTYLALFGDTGLLGVAVYVCAILYIAVIAPFRRPGPETTTGAVFAMMILAAGFTEARDTLVPSIATFLILALRGEAFSASSAPIADPKHMRGPQTHVPGLRPAQPRLTWT